MKTYPFGRIRGVLFLGLMVTMLLLGLISKCIRGEDPKEGKLKHHRDYHL